jgi:hypothetical protein
MWTLPQSPLQKIGVVFYGLAIGVGTALCTSATFLVLGVTISLIAQSTVWIHLGEYQPWLPIIGLEYGFFLGLVIGAFVCWRVWRTRSNA